MIEKLEKLLNSLLAAAAEVHTYYARQNGGELSLKDSVTEEPKGRKARTSKPESVNPAVVPVVSEADSQRQTEDTARALVQRFNKPVDGKPQGFHTAKALLAELGAQRLHDLKHAQRLQFVAKAREIIAQADGKQSIVGEV